MALVLTVLATSLILAGIRLVLFPRLESASPTFPEPTPTAYDNQQYEPEETPTPEPYLPQEPEDELPPEEPDYTEYPNYDEYPEPPEITGINYQTDGGVLELPVAGATGWAAVSLPMREAPITSPAALTLQVLAPGQGFTVLEEHGEWWYVRLGGESATGWVEHKACFINLPDVVPSIIYRITNARASVKRSGGNEIPGITGEQLYDAFSYNPRLGRYEYIVPALYSTARRLAQAQQAALTEGNTIIMYEAFRPRYTQRSVVNGMNALMDANSEVRTDITAPPWSLGWFISTGISNHQRGAAIDTSLGRVNAMETRASGEFIFMEITEFEDYVMPTPMHELSPRAAIFSRPMTINSAAELANAPFAETITEGALLMQGYFATVGFMPLASEWWHFNDRASLTAISDFGHNGDFFIDRIYSTQVISP